MTTKTQTDIFLTNFKKAVSENNLESVINLFEKNKELNIPQSKLEHFLTEASMLDTLI